jgi:hypothetical protein
LGQRSIGYYEEMVKALLASVSQLLGRLDVPAANSLTRPSPGDPCCPPWLPGRDSRAYAPASCVIKKTVYTVFFALCRDLPGKDTVKRF